ncbi:MAG: hypothetical protein JSV09_07955 [Thermoplasmata archaeon]|nr:MAG: hypothetical protein JSV09_07955 [Thermoplasmata archaeon]
MMALTPLGVVAASVDFQVAFPSPPSNFPSGIINKYDFEDIKILSWKQISRIFWRDIIQKMEKNKKKIRGNIKDSLLLGVMK